MTWGGVAAGVGSVAGALISSSNSPGGSSTVPNTSGVAQDWQNLFGQNIDLINGLDATTMPLFTQGLDNLLNFDYSPYIDAANQAGNIYSAGSQAALDAIPTMNKEAGIDLSQQGNLYNAANSIWNTASDPQNALYNRTAAQLTDQTNAGQALRGLGNSGEGASEYNQAMSNFNIDWQNNLLNREATGATAMANLSNAGLSQGNSAVNDITGAVNMYSTSASDALLSGQIPMQAQMTAALAPMSAAQAYSGDISQLAGLYGDLTAGAIPYISAGVGATQWQQQFQAQQNAANVQALMSLFGNTNTQNSLSNLFGNNATNNTMSSGSTGDVTTGMQQQLDNSTIDWNTSSLVDNGTVGSGNSLSSFFDMYGDK